MTEIIIFLTNRCNLKCKYCPVTKNKKKLNFSFIKKILKHFLKSDKKELKVRFTGGEPLLEFRLIKKIVEYLKRENKKNRKIKYYLITNGTIFSEEIITFLKKNNFSITISIDGTSSTHNANRLFIRNKESYKIVIENFKKFKKNFTNIKISSVISYNNKNIKEDLDTLMLLRPSEISLNLNFEEYKLSKNKKLHKKLVNKISDWYTAYFLKNQKLPKIHNINHVLMRFYAYKVHKKRFPKTICDASCGDKISVFPEKVIYPCFWFKEKKTFRFDISHINKSINFYRYFYTIYFKQSKKCSSCRAKNVCRKLICPGQDFYLAGKLKDTKQSCSQSLLDFDISKRIFYILKSNKLFNEILEKKVIKEKII
jgi:uncharacterized protein